MKLIQQSRRQKRGAALVEYGLIVAGVALVAAAAVSVFGHKTAGMIGASAALLPGTTEQENGAIAVGEIIDTHKVGNKIELDTTGENSIGQNLGLSDTQMGELVQDP